MHQLDSSCAGTFFRIPLGHYILDSLNVIKKLIIKTLVL